MTERSVVVGRDGRAKAYRPLPPAARASALAAGLAAYERGDFFEAHEELEPAWMGTDVVAERALLQGLIKVAAAYVHDVRGNPPGITRNLIGARALLFEALADGPADNVAGVDIGALIDAVDARLADLAAHPDHPTLGPPTLAAHVDPATLDPATLDGHVDPATLDGHVDPATLDAHVDPPTLAAHLDRPNVGPPTLPRSPR